jgi:spermidine/putrescine-binding protein
MIDLAARVSLRRSRRMAVASVGFTLLLVALAIAAGANASGKQSTKLKLTGTINVATYGGDDDTTAQKVYWGPFTALTGVTFALDPSGSDQVAKLQAQESSNNVTYSLIQPSPEDASALGAKGYLEPFPADIMALAKKTLSPGTYNKWDIAHGVSGSVFWCLKTLKKCPTNAKQFFDVANYPGRRAMYAAGYLENVMYALEADGVPVAKLFPLNLNRAFKKLTRFKKSVNIWWTTGAQSQQIATTGQADMGVMWDGRANVAIADGAKIKLSHDGVFVDSASWAVPKNAPNKEAAFEFIRWYIKNAKGQAEYMKAMHYAEPNPAAYKYIPISLRKQFATYPSNASKEARTDLAWVNKNYNQLVTRWNKWLHS